MAFEGERHVDICTLQNLLVQAVRLKEQVELNYLQICLNHLNTVVYDFDLSHITVLRTNKE